MHTASLGRRDLVTDRPVERDTIFRIASMTKPVTTVAALMLLDEGRLTLNDPIARYAPEFGRMRVLRDPEWSARRNRCDGTANHVRRFADAPLRPDLRRLPSWSDRACLRRCPRGPDRQRLCPDEWIAETRHAAVDRSAGARLSLRTLDRPARLPHRPSRGCSAQRGPRAANLQTAGHERHGLRRASREAGAPGGLCGFDAEGL